MILADAWFPTPWPRLPEFAPAPTVEMSVYYRAPLPLPDSLLLGRFENRLVRDGFFDESGELWAPDGTLVAQCRQLGLLLGRALSPSPEGRTSRIRSLSGTCGTFGWPSLAGPSSSTGCRSEQLLGLRRKPIEDRTSGCPAGGW